MGLRGYGWGCFFLLFGVFSLGISSSFGATYLVRLKGDRKSEKIQNFDADSLHLKRFQQEALRELRRAKKVQLFERTQTLVLESDSEAEILNFVKNHPEVQHYEKNVQWRPFSTPSSLPSSQNQSPWLKDVLGLEVDVPNYQEAYSGSSPIIVAVVDTGLNVQHPFIQSGLARNYQESAANPGVDNDGNGYTNDIYGANVYTKNGDVSENGSDHGTHVVGLVKSIRDQAIPQNSEARAVQIMPVKFIDDSGFGSTAGAVAALDYAASRGARVVNASWGAVGASAYSQALFDAMASLYSQNVFVAVAAGNAEGGVANNNDSIPVYPASFKIPGMMSVASVTPSYQNEGGGNILFQLSLSDFSNYGQSVDVASVGDYRDSNGELGVLSMNAFYGSPGESAFIKMRGTSMAAPVLAGVAAVVRAINPSLTAFEVKQLLLETAQKSSALNRIGSSSVINAKLAFASARLKQSQGLQPSIPDQGRKASASVPASRRSSGCGTIEKEEPWTGGNSLGLFTGIYVLYCLLRPGKKSLFSNKKQTT